MPNTFEAVPDAKQERSTAFLEVEAPADRLEAYMEEAQLHRGSLREQDGYTIPFREGGQVRITVEEGGEAGGSGLRFVVAAPNAERRRYIEEDVSEQIGSGSSLTWSAL